MARVIGQPCDAGVIRSKKAEAPCTPDAAPWVLTTTILGSSMAFIDKVTVPVALPAVQSALDANAVDVQWVMTAYVLLLASLILTGGSLGDHLGRRRVFSIGVGLFALASAWCGLAPNIEQLIAARGLQGIGAALFVPNSLAIIGASFEGKLRSRAIGTWTSLTSVALILGMVLGGYLVDNVSWRAVFFINVPLALTILAMAHSRVPESRDPQAKRLDLPGAILIAASLGGIVFGLLEASRVGLEEPPAWVSLLVGVVALGAFLVVEDRAREPMIPLSLFRSGNFAGANVFTLLLDFAVSGTLFFLPFDLIWVRGYSATAAGAAMVPAVFLMFLLSPYTGKLANRFGARLPLVLGPALVVAGLCLLAVPAEGGPYWATCFPAAVVLGVGLSVLVPAETTVALNSVDARHEGIASAINNAVSQTTGLLAIAVLGVLLFGSFGNNLEDRLATLELPPVVRQQLGEEKAKLGAMEVPRGLDAGLSAQVEQAIDGAFVSGYRVVMLVAAAAALSSAIIAAFLIKDTKPGADPGVASTEGPAVRVREGVTPQQSQTLCPAAWQGRAEDSRQAVDELSLRVAPSLRRGRSPPDVQPLYAFELRTLRRAPWHRFQRRRLIDHRSPTI